MVTGLRTYRLWTLRSPTRATRMGLGGTRFLFAVLARPRPQQGLALATFVIEQVRVDRGVEGGVVEFEREIISAFLRALRPACSDLGAAHKDAVARSLVVAGIALGDDADAFGLQAEGDDFALE